MINGPAVLAYDLSKARQLSLFARCGLDIPATRVAHRRADVPRLAAEVGYPVMVKVNVGGSGAGMIRYDTAEDLDAAVADGLTPVGVDGVALVQEYVPARDARVIRCEVLDGRLLYAIALDGAGLDLRSLPGRRLHGRQADHHHRGLTGRRRRSSPRSSASPPPRQMDVGGIEYLIDDRDGRARFYDLNALSNFVAKPLRGAGLGPARAVRELADRPDRAHAGPA